jgi:hypothetical protein
VSIIILEMNRLYSVYYYHPMLEYKILITFHSHLHYIKYNENISLKQILIHLFTITIYRIPK